MNELLKATKLVTDIGEARMLSVQGEDLAKWSLPFSKKYVSEEKK